LAANHLDSGGIDVSRPYRPLSDDEVKCFLLFGMCAPSFRALPHLIFKPFPELVDALAYATGRRAGAWPLGPPYFGDGRIELGNDLPFSEWANPYNQDELRYLCRGGGSLKALVNAFVDESVLSEVLSDDLFRVSNGIWPSIPQLVDRLEWLAVPTEHFTDIVFVCHPNGGQWITRLREQAVETGQEWSEVVARGDTIEIRGYLTSWHVILELRATVEEIMRGNMDVASWPIARHRWEQREQRGTKGT
jgi:hypothetical protein